MSHETEFALLDEFIDAPPGSAARRAALARLQATPTGRRLIAWHLDLQEMADTRETTDVTARVADFVKDLPKPVAAGPVATGEAAGVFGTAAAATRRHTSDRRSTAKVSERTGLGAWLHGWFAPRIAPGLTVWRLVFATLSLAFVVILFAPGLAGLRSDVLAGAAVRGMGPGWVAVGLGCLAVALLWWLGRRRRS